MGRKASNQRILNVPVHVLHMSSDRGTDNPKREVMTEAASNHATAGRLRKKSEEFEEQIELLRGRRVWYQGFYSLRFS
jgi:hypothetical protein